MLALKKSAQQGKVLERGVAEISRVSYRKCGTENVEVLESPASESIFQSA